MRCDLNDSWARHERAAPRGPPLWTRPWPFSAAPGPPWSPSGSRSATRPPCTARSRCSPRPSRWRGPRTAACRTPDRVVVITTSLLLWCCRPRCPPLSRQRPRGHRRPRRPPHARHRPPRCPLRSRRPDRHRHRHRCRRRQRRRRRSHTAP